MEIHRTNIKLLIKRSNSFRNFIGEMESKTKLFDLLGANNFGKLEDEFPELLKICIIFIIFKKLLIEKLSIHLYCNCIM